MTLPLEAMEPSEEIDPGGQNQRTEEPVGTDEHAPAPGARELDSALERAHRLVFRRAGIRVVTTSEFVGHKHAAAVHQLIGGEALETD
ncbi:hypothetical protein [Sorangium sp. So ce1389]|uniref:hypothetical protein n=1 Tax=Sorangium sp. So ce1389 TaxID=3133336 RepID=UPI003F62F95A